jgi:hypothetical protein
MIMEAEGNDVALRSLEAALAERPLTSEDSGIRILNRAFSPQL